MAMKITNTSYLDRSVVGDIDELVVDRHGVGVGVDGLESGDLGVDWGVDPDPQGDVALTRQELGVVVVDVVDHHPDLNLVQLRGVVELVSRLELPLIRPEALDG